MTMTSRASVRAEATSRGVMSGQPTVSSWWPTISNATYSTPYTRNETLMPGGSTADGLTWSPGGAAHHPIG
jgi:hypothetical protein